MSESEALVAAVAAELRARGWTCATAESCTGGLVGHWLTNLSGSSEFYLGGVIAYSNEAKQHVLGVPAELLQTHGAVSAQVAVAMAQGARQLLHTHVAVAVTGIAGPTGGTPAKPVGTVYVAVASSLGELVRLYHWDQDRLGNKRLSAEAALRLLSEHLASQ